MEYEDVDVILKQDREEEIRRQMDEQLREQLMEQLAAPARIGQALAVANVLAERGLTEAYLVGSLARKGYGSDIDLVVVHPIPEVVDQFEADCFDGHRELNYASKTERLRAFCKVLQLDPAGDLLTARLGTTLEILLGLHQEEHHKDFKGDMTSWPEREEAYRRHYINEESPQIDIFMVEEGWQEDLELLQRYGDMDRLFAYKVSRDALRYSPERKSFELVENRSIRLGRAKFLWNYLKEQPTKMPDPEYGLVALLKEMGGSISLDEICGNVWELMALANKCARLHQEIILPQKLKGLEREGDDLFGRMIDFNGCLAIARPPIITLPRTYLDFRQAHPEVSRHVQDYLRELSAIIG